MRILRGDGPRTGWLLLASTALLTGCGCWLLAAPVRVPVARTAGPRASAAAPAAADSAPAGAPAVAASPPKAAVPAAPHPDRESSPLPPLGEGKAADSAIQRALENAWPADLPKADAQKLVAAARALLRADATGAGRSRWPSVFGTGERRPLAPAFTRFRIQAVIARKDTDAAGRAVVHLVWAAADRGGTYIDGRISDLSFIRTGTKGHQSWTPQLQR